MCSPMLDDLPDQTMTDEFVTDHGRGPVSCVLCPWVTTGLVDTAHFLRPGFMFPIGTGKLLQSDSLSPKKCPCS